MQVGGAYNMRVIVRGACAPEGEELFVLPEKKQWTYREKMAQANREAKATVVALAIVVVVWIAAGFGLSAFDVEVFGTPIWVFARNAWHMDCRHRGGCGAGPPGVRRFRFG